MSYENAPATKLIAAFCACCSRPLVDAESVETGMGPHCRKKHGYATPEVEHELLAVASVLASVLTFDEYAELIAKAGTAREAANVLVHRVAALQCGERVPFYVAAIEALGFRSLAARISKRLKAITVETDEPGYKLRVFSPYSAEFVESARKIGGRAVKLGPKSWAWDFPLQNRKALWSVLKSSYPKGTPVHGEKGLAVL